MSDAHLNKTQTATDSHLDQGHDKKFETTNSDDNTSETNRQIHTIKTSNGCEMCVPDNINDLVSYVLMEQETWFESELNFLMTASDLLPRAIDISALYGIYSIPLATKLKKIFVFEANPITSWYLNKSIEKNRLHNISLMSTEKPNANQPQVTHNSPETFSTSPQFNLDKCCDFFKIDNIDLLIINLGGDEQHILTHAQHFLKNNQALIMLRRNNELEISTNMLHIFQEYDYDCYYLIPGINILTSLEDLSILESSSTNLFFCKKLTAKRLEQSGLLATSLNLVEEEDSNNRHCDIDIAQQLEQAFSDYPYATSLSNHWEYGKMAEQVVASHYQKSLHYYFLAHDTKQNSKQRVAYLMEAFNSLSESLQTQADLPQLLTLARISLELSLTSTALQSLSLILETFCSDQIMAANEPFLTPHYIFDQVDPDECFGEWVFSSVLQTYLWTKSYSSYFMTKNELQTLQGLISDPFIQARTERCRQLLSLRLGASNTFQAHKVLAQKSPLNLNAKFWSGDKS
ncbi:hypothetical protein MNBD_GAMMA12-3763 [hydrothermal vent metagenome]|uniref:SAM-dependent methyltransferase TRM5/TYW2-type domain-containing protein n=1 Tax=hydrothermal vent metagenome TaxID=652676 RepID=A0A3B0YCF6_9ZZZZ